MKIPKGNAFHIVLCPDNLAPANPEGVTFADIDVVGAALSRKFAGTKEVPYEITDIGDIDISIPADLVCTAYGLEVTGEYNGEQWRWKAFPMFRIVDTNDKSNMGEMETFAAERYFIGDTIEFELEGDELCLSSHYMVSLEDGVLTLVSDEPSIKITDKNKILEIRHGNKENSGERPTWSCDCIG